MKKNTKHSTVLYPIKADFVEHFWEQSWTYIKTVVDVIREPILILDKDLCVMAANESFYKTFQVDPKDTEKSSVYKLGNGQWNIPNLRKLLEDILPKNTFFNGFEVSHDFPLIGHKVMILNARQIYVKENGSFPPIILLAIEDITDMMHVAKTFADHTKNIENKLTKKTDILETQIMELEKEIKKLKILKQK